jgi:hypothetical protein
MTSLRRSASSGNPRSAFRSNQTRMSFTPTSRNCHANGRLRSHTLLLPSGIAAARMTAAMAPMSNLRGRWRLVRGAIQTSAGAHIH